MLVAFVFQETIQVSYKGYTHDFSGYFVSLVEQTHTLLPYDQGSSTLVLSLPVSLQSFHAIQTTYKISKPKLYINYIYIYDLYGLGL